ncbi:uncharacterized protein [Macaca nemestrina]|uniref:uncharacterized protein n=1 Tax=Macaca nemestrina TaxID=9545 RepID=UPI0039B8FDE9
MGNTQSAPLSLLTSNFKDVRARGHDLSLEIRRGKLITLCRSEWPAFNVEWPPEGTFRIAVITRNPPPYPSGPQAPAPRAKPGERAGRWEAASTQGPAKSKSNFEGPAGWTQGRTSRASPLQLPDSTVALPLQEIGPPDDTGIPRLHPFGMIVSSSSESCSQRKSEKEYRPAWDYNTAEGREWLRLYRQTLMAGLWAAARKPTNLAKGFKNSPTLFDEALHEDLGEYRRKHPEVTLLQNVDDLLIAAETQEACIQGTNSLLQALGNLGYRASAKKAQICKPEVTYLGYLLKRGQRWLTDAWKQTVLQIPRPQSTQQVREFLGSAGFYRLWIPGFAELAKPLYQATWGQQPFNWTDEAESAFQQIKTALLSVPALGLLDVTKPFHLYMDESKGVAKAVITQNLGPWRRPVAYLSKKLDPVAARWPPCLQMIAATALMVQDADKLVMGQQLRIVTPHAIKGVLKQPPNRWISNAWFTHYQGLLLNPIRITFLPPTTLNPASLLPNPDLDTPLHDCTEILAQVHGVGEDLQDRPLPDANLVWFTDGSSFMHQGQRYAGAAVTSETEILFQGGLKHFQPKEKLLRL